MERPTSNIFIVIFTALYGGCLALTWWTGVDGPYINSYPFISNDGYDLIFQGHALFHRLVEGEGVYLPILRQPVMVLIWFVDRALLDNGTVLLTLNIAAYSGTLIVLRSLFPKDLSEGATVCLLSAYAFLPFHIYSFFVLTENIAIFFGLLAFRYATELTTKQILSNEKPGRELLPLLFFSVLAGITKTYAMIPALIVLGLGSLFLLFSKRIVDTLKFSLFILSIGFSHIAIIYGWRSLFDYGKTPKTFALLELSSEMTEFYLEVFAYVGLYLAPLIALGLAALTLSFFKKSGGTGELIKPYHKERLILLSCLTVIGAQAILAYFYQAADARFTFISLPYLMIALGGIFTITKVSSSLLFSLFASIALFYFPLFTYSMSPSSGFFKPLYSTLKYAPEASWLMAWRSGPLDRYQLRKQCGELRFCKKVVPPPQSREYRTLIFKAYTDLMKTELENK